MNSKHKNFYLGLIWLFCGLLSLFATIIPAATALNYSEFSPPLPWYQSILYLLIPVATIVCFFMSTSKLFGIKAAIILWSALVIGITILVMVLTECIEPETVSAINVSSFSTASAMGYLIE